MRISPLLLGSLIFFLGCENLTDEQKQIDEFVGQYEGWVNRMYLLTNPETKDVLYYEVNESIAYYYDGPFGNIIKTITDQYVIDSLLVAIDSVNSLGTTFENINANLSRSANDIVISFENFEIPSMRFRQIARDTITDRFGTTFIQVQLEPVDMGDFELFFEDVIRLEWDISPQSNRKSVSYFMFNKSNPDSIYMYDPFLFSVD